MTVATASLAGKEISSAHAPEIEPDRSAAWLDRPRVAGKFLYVGAEKLWLKGVTYGTFRPDPDGVDYPFRAIVDRDFAAMYANGFNLVRTYTAPPRWLLDTAARHGLRTLVGLAWEQHVAFLDDRSRAKAIEQRVRAAARSCAGHPAVLGYTIGNEIPAPIVRWHGAQRIERFLKRLYRAVRAEDPEALVTYVNYPTTEYLQLPFLDLVCFNVYLESDGRLEAYLARLQNLAGERPLLLAEIGLDSRRHGMMAQAESLSWQVRTAFTAGCAGAVVFSWTDEWFRGGHDIEDWDFGLSTRTRAPKPALAAVRSLFASVPLPSEIVWPHISIVVCSYNGSRTIRDTLEGLKNLAYPNFKVIVVNDGSTDATPAISGEYDVRLISTENRGLSNARNTGWQEATGEIIAYIDDDAYPDPHWLQYLAYTFMTSDFVGVGGPNIAPPDDGPIADCIANAPGGPVHVLISDREAEHIPGCNMAFRREALAAIGGFDPRYRAAGDDVDLCWRLQERGWKIGFHAAAMVWHHRRNSIRSYWKQQQGYGKAEALLEEKWPEKYNAVGHLAWRGQMYGKGFAKPLQIRRGRIYQGSWGTALFQRLYQPAAGTLLTLPLMLEWYLVIASLGALSMVGFLWAPLLATLPVLGMAIGISVVQAVVSASEASFTSYSTTLGARMKLRSVTTLLHLMQPLARLMGRLRHGLTPWRRRGPAQLAFPWRRDLSVWSEQWRAPADWIGAIEELLRQEGMVVTRGGDYDLWDLETRGGLFGGAQLLVANEEHGAGCQHLRFRLLPRWSRGGLWFSATVIVLAGGATADGAGLASVLLGTTALAFVARAGHEAAVAVAGIRRAVQSLGAKDPR